METAERLMRILDEWLGGGPRPRRTLSIFIRDNELAWLRGRDPRGVLVSGMPSDVSP